MIDVESIFIFKINVVVKEGVLSDNKSRHIEILYQNLLNRWRLRDCTHNDHTKQTLWQEYLQN